MKRLIKHLPIILIGLNILTMEGCILTEFDPPDKYYDEKYRNSSSNQVMLIMRDISTSDIVKSFSISAGDEKSGLYVNTNFNGGKEPIKNYVDDLVRNNIQKIELHVDGSLIKEWQPSVSGQYENGVNNPFNYDSWLLETGNEIEEGVEGKIVFTITNDDINN